jgi:sodium-dependent dicarboxylate transporter 2/3/5
MKSDSSQANGYSLVRRVGLLLGIVLFLLILFLPTADGLTPEAQRVAAVAILMSVWWITEALPLYATALLPLILFPLLGVFGAQKVAAPYAEPTIFLFMGGFFLAMAMQRWGLHRRIALYTIRLLGTQPRQLLLGFMVATAVMSMWVSNTATTMMVYPIGLAIASQLVPSSAGQSNKNGFAVALMLGIAYAASIGGMGTLIGTPPNAIFAGQSKLLFPELNHLSFFDWMLIGIPYVLIFLPFAWLYLSFTHIRNSQAGGDLKALSTAFGELGPVSRGELGVFVVFVLTVCGWLFRSDINLGFVTLPGWSTLLGIEAWVQDATVAIAAAVLLFIVPVNLKKGEFLLNWEWAVKIPWGILILFGGGFALALGFQETGLANWIGQGLAGLSGIPLLLLIFILCIVITLAGEVASNTAIAAAMMPILGATAVAMGVHPFVLMIPATMAASSGFMLPVATPPNAIVFGSGALTIRQMVRAGIVLDIIGAVIITLADYFIAIPVFNLR